MKRFLVIALALALLCLPGSALAAGKSSIFGTSPAATEAPAEAPDASYSADGFSADEIRSAVADFLDSIEWTYSIDADSGNITFGMNIDSKLGSLDYVMRFFDNGFTTYAYPSVYADSNSMVDIAEYLHRANRGLRNGNFELDFSDGEIRYKSYVDCSNALPGPDVIRRTISVPGDMFEIYGDGLLQVSFHLTSPADAIEAAEKE